MMSYEELNSFVAAFADLHKIQSDNPCLVLHARRIALELDNYFPRDEAQVRQAMCLAEEAGEFLKAARRYLNMARKPGDRGDVISELADVVITAYVTAQVYEIDLDMAINSKLHEIYNRGWKEPRNEETNSA